MALTDVAVRTAKARVKSYKHSDSGGLYLLRRRVFQPVGEGHAGATARRPTRFPTMEQVKHVLANMPSSTDIERRDRALVAFVLLTGARDSAVASMRLKHVDLMSNSVSQDAREVKTKFSKTFTTYFFPVGDNVRQIVEEWVRHLREEKLGMTTPYSRPRRSLREPSSTSRLSA